MTDPETPTRRIPREVYNLPIGQRIRWARQKAKLSHDRLVALIGRSNRGHLIKIEQGYHIPRQDLRDVIADAVGVPREFFADDPQEAARAGDPFHQGSRRDVRDGARPSRPAARRAAARADQQVKDAA